MKVNLEEGDKRYLDWIINLKPKFAVSSFYKDLSQEDQNELDEWCDAMSNIMNSELVRLGIFEKVTPRCNHCHTFYGKLNKTSDGKTLCDKCLDKLGE